uniref:protein phosphatase n=1 Tax=Stappia sp. TaxID=1870903 RepID=UPI003BAB5FAA
MTDHAPLLAPHLEETQEDRLPVLLPVAEMPGATLYLGNRIAADDGALLLERGITSTMNLAVNIEMAPLTLADGTAVRRTHVGLIDGRGNTPPHLLGAALVLAGILGQASPGKSHYPPHRAGNVLVHCRGGRSRSVSVLALFLVLARPELHPDLETAFRHLRHLRGLPASQPNADMLALTDAALALAGGPGLLAR